MIVKNGSRVLYSTRQLLEHTGLLMGNDLLRQDQVISVCIVGIPLENILPLRSSCLGSTEMLGTMIFTLPGATGMSKHWFHSLLPFQDLRGGFPLKPLPVVQSCYVYSFCLISQCSSNYGKLRLRQVM